MHGLIRWLQARAEDVAVLLLAAMFASFILQIGSRYVFNAPMTWTLEACLTTWLWSVFWGAAFLLKEKDHVKFDVIYGMMGEKTKRIMALVSAVFIAAGFLISLPATADYVAFMSIKKSVTLGIRLDYVFSVYVIFMVAMVLFYGVRAWRLIMGTSPDLLDDPTAEPDASSPNTPS